MSKAILIVEDDRELARTLARALEERGYQTQLAYDGDDALRAVGRQPPDLILLDLLLPRRDGRAVLSTLQQAEATRAIPVVAMSGVLRRRDHERDILAAGARVFLSKPFSLADLLQTLERLLGLRGRTGPQQLERFELAQKPVAETLFEAASVGFTGAIHFRSEQRHKQLLMEAGQPRAIRSNMVRECLGRRLVDSGRIQDHAHQEALRRAKNSDRLQGEILVRMGALPAVQLEEALAAQGEAKLRELFSWTEGEAWLQPGVRDAKLASALPGWTIRRAILRGVEMMSEGLARERLAPYASETVVAQEIELDPAERTQMVVACLDALGHETTVADLWEEHAPMLYGLQLVGALSFGEKGAALAEPPGPASAEAMRSEEEERPDSPAVELTLLRERQAKQNHFEVLGASERSSAEEIRKLFVGLAKKFHPDRFQTESQAAQALAAQVFSDISVAHDTLSDSRRRKEYVAELRRGGAKSDRKAVARIVSAEREFRKGRENMHRRSYPDALACFERALELDPREGEFWALAGWTYFLVHQEDPAERGEAVRRLKEAQSLAPRSPSGYYYMGLLYKACERPVEAEVMFRETLGISGGHIEAARELRLLERRRRNRKQGGGLGSLFGLGKKKS